jgi:hypothetical protein
MVEGPGRNYIDGASLLLERQRWSIDAVCWAGAGPQAEDGEAGETDGLDGTASSVQQIARLVKGLPRLVKGLARLVKG